MLLRAFVVNSIMKAEELEQRIRRLRLTSRRLIHIFGEGSFRTLFHGRGIEFATLREYVPGDDIRRIDWNTTARRGTPYVKTFIEERDLSVMLVIDLSSSMEIKMEALSQLVAVLTTLADYLDDRIGCLGFSDRVEFFLPPARNIRQPEHILHRLLQQKSYIRKTSISLALGFLRRVLKKHTILFLISDFLDRNFEIPLLALSKKHEVVGVHLYDPLEANLRHSVVIDGVDPETGRRYLMDGYDRYTRDAYREFFHQQKKLVIKAFQRSSTDLLSLSSGPDVELQLIEFLRRRQTSRGPLQQAI